MIQSYYGKIYSAGYDGGDRHHLIVAFYLDQWRQAGSPTPVLEPMCGTGLNLLPFLEAGVEIDGFDASPYMLAECGKSCAAKGFKPKLYQQFFEEIDLPRQYGFTFIPGGSFGHIYDKALAQACLRRLGDHLLPGGYFVLDLRMPAYRQVFAQNNHVDFSVDDLPDGSTLFGTSVWSDKDNGRIIRCWNKFEKYVNGVLNETEIFDYHERFYDQAEFINMLQAANFAEIKVSKAHLGEGPGADDWLVYSCRRP
jgi:hypothetical protein